MLSGVGLRDAHEQADCLQVGRARGAGSCRRVIRTGNRPAQRDLLAKLSKHLGRRRGHVGVEVSHQMSFHTGQASTSTGVP